MGKREQSVIFCLYLWVVTCGGQLDEDYDGERQCVAYGICHTTGDLKFQNCPYKGPPKLFNNETALKVLEKLCPEFYGDGKDLHLCCSPRQILNMERSTNLARSILGRCPSCFRNFMSVFCQQACSPYQNKFLEVKPEWIKNGTFEKKSRRYISQMNYYLTNDYLESVFDSCKNVQFSGSGEPALRSMCGSYDPCTGFRWFGFMGDPEMNPYAPFRINFMNTSGEVVYENHTFVALNVTTVECNQAPDEQSSACSCQDCPKSCSAVAPYPSSIVEPCKMFGIDCMVLITAVIFCGCCLFIFVTAALSCISNKRNTAKYTIASTSPSLKDKDGLITEKDVSIFENMGAYLETKLEELFYSWGITCTRHPMLVFTFGLAISGVCSSGLFFVHFTTDPVDLWSSASSRGRVEKEYFDKKFGPFYRTEQMIVVPKKQALYKHTDPETFEIDYLGPVFDKEFLHEVLRLQTNISKLVGRTEKGKNVTLQDICFKPLAPDNQNCTIQSLLQYFQNDPDLLDKEFNPIEMKENLGFGFDYESGDGWEIGDEDADWGMGDDDYLNGEVKLTDDGNVGYIEHIKSCVLSPLQVNDTTQLHMNCLGAYGGPIFPFVVLGGFNYSGNYMSARALVITFVVNNDNDKEKQAKAEAWESEFIEYLHNFSSPNFTVSYMAERSIQDEIKRESRSDVFTIVISYLFMFGYIAFALGQYHVHGNNLCYLLVHSKVMLGVAGVVIVALSVTSSIGVYAYCGIPATMIILEVQPFLVLAVGVDNIFIFVQAYQRGRHTKAESLEQRIGRISGEVVPSMLLSSLAECFCFFLGALSSMPAVKVFSLYAAMAIFFDFFLQITCFLALFTLDIRREEAGRLELCCCARLPTKHSENEGFLYSIFKKCYAPFLLSKYIRLTVLVTFLGWLFSSIAVLDKIPLGLDQRLSVPEDSYVLTHFNGMKKYLSVGPPVYFVVKGQYDYNKHDLQNKICGSAGCNQNSLYGQVYSASHYPNNSYISHPPMSWLDDYFDWMRPGGNPTCCRLYQNNSFCPATVKNGHCHQCVEKYPKGRPKEDDFYPFLKDYLNDNPTTKCAKGGHAAYSHALKTEIYGSDPNNLIVDASHYMTYHTILKTSEDFIQALINARKICHNITRDINMNLTQGQKPVEVFPYSVFYVFYEQYLSIAEDAVLQLLLSLGAIFVVTSIFLGLDPWAGAIISVTIAMILLDLMALMYWWDIEFNAISLVNLVMAIGISVEFCSHITRAFVLSLKTERVDRSRDALANMGSSVLSGITLTKFGGIVVLAFSHSQIFKVYYFRMYLGIVLFGAAHGLIFLPVLLSFLGPSINKRKLLTRQQEEQAEIMEEVHPTVLVGHHRSGEALVQPEGEIGPDPAESEQFPHFA